MPKLLHRNNGLAVGPDERLYLGVGSASNFGEVPESSLSAAILRCDLDGAGVTRFASGFRNPFDLTFSPSGELFGTDNGRDRSVLSASDPPDELNHVIEGGDYGHPSYWGTPPADSGTRGPVVEIAPHSAASGLVVYTGPQAGEYEGDVLVANWGPGSGRSSNAHNVIRTKLTPQGDTYSGAPTPFITGLNRPTDLAIGPGGDLFVSDHVDGKVYRFRRSVRLG
ncbi:MAG: PQQ-dependent sugar dehydrogenase [Actinobacteria bacterium]|nr:PQQ-dependent sugar dehydrogenase [Actinomycetota bacterium]